MQVFGPSNCVALSMILHLDSRILISTLFPAIPHEVPQFFVGIAFLAMACGCFSFGSFKTLFLAVSLG